jgi:putative transposase
LILRYQLAVLQRRQPRCPNLNWADRALLAALPGVIPKARRHGLPLLVTPDTILRWHRHIVRRRWAARSMRRHDRPAGDPPQHQGPGPPDGPRESPMGVPQDPRAGWPWSQGSGVNGVGHSEEGRNRPRAAPIRAYLAAAPALPGRDDPGCDFLTADLLDGTQAHVLAVIEHAVRRIRILGVTLHPTGEWTAQQARNLLMDLGDQAHRVKFMIRDRGSDYTASFGAILADAGIRTVLCNVRTPRMNAIAERWIGGRRRELLDRTLIWNQSHLRQIPGPVRDPPQPAPASPVTGRRCPAEATTRTGRS